MAFSETKEAIGAVSEMLQTKLIAKTGVPVTISSPESAAKSNAEGEKLNIFLYQIDFDASLKNYPLDAGQLPPLWVVLHYLITAFDTSKESDTIDAHKLLGRGLAALQDLNFLRPNPASPSDAPLLSNPEPLKMTFNIADAELLSKIMQGSDEKYRVSSAFQIRPVMIMPESLPSFAPVVKTIGPPAAPGIVVIPSMGPKLTKLTPERFEAGATLTIEGLDMGGITEVCFGDTCYIPTITGTGDKMEVTVPLATTLSPGSYPVTGVRVLPSGRRFSSNALLGHMLPTLATAVVGALTPSGGKLFGDLTLTGTRLGGPDDGIFVALYKDGKTAVMVEVTGVVAQNTLTASVTIDKAIPTGTYLVILRVNGEQATNAIQVNWV
jgi:hypothetical protein